MELLLPLLSVFLLSCSGITSAQDVAALVKVNVGSEAVLPCSIIPEQDITGDVFDWKKDGQKEVFFYQRGKHPGQGQDEQFKGRVFHFPDQLKFSNASIVIRDTKLSDSGNYTCDFSPDDANRQTFNIELVVGPCPKPYVTLRKGPNNRLILECEVKGVSPKPKVEWQDRAGNKLPAEEPQVTDRGGSYDIVLQATVTKTDDYRCVVTQEEICHQASNEIFVPVPGSAGHVAADVAVTLVVALVGVLAKCFITQN
ncbi:butyrophilin-like protein 1 [Symphorus nematophorus]